MTQAGSLSKERCGRRDSPHEHRYSFREALNNAAKKPMGYSKVETSTPLTSVRCNPDVVVRIRRVSPGEHHQLRYHPAEVSHVEHVQRVPKASIPRRQRPLLHHPVVLQMEVARDILNLVPRRSVCGTPHVTASALEIEIVCLVQLASTPDNPQPIFENSGRMTCVMEEYEPLHSLQLHHHR